MPPDQTLAAKGAVWITRAEPGARVTAERVAALGFIPIIAPLLSFRPLAADLAFQGDEALAFTSINGVMRTAALTDRRDGPVFAVGDATANAARTAGFTHVVSAGGDVQALADLIVRAAPPAVLHLCALQTAGDLVGVLGSAGVKARKLPVYEAVEAAALPALVRAALEDKTLSAILIHSPKAAKTAARLLKGERKALEAVFAVGLSPACIAPFHAFPLQAKVAAPEPTEDALMRTLGDLCWAS